METILGILEQSFKALAHAPGNQQMVVPTATSVTSDEYRVREVAGRGLQELEALMVKLKVK